MAENAKDFGSYQEFKNWGYESSEALIANNKFGQDQVRAIREAEFLVNDKDFEKALNDEVFSKKGKVRVTFADKPGSVSEVKEIMIVHADGSVSPPLNGPGGLAAPFLDKVEARLKASGYKGEAPGQPGGPPATSTSTSPEAGAPGAGTNSPGLDINKAKEEIQKRINSTTGEIKAGWEHILSKLDEAYKENKHLLIKDGKLDLSDLRDWAKGKGEEVSKQFENAVSAIGTAGRDAYNIVAPKVEKAAGDIGDTLKGFFSTTGGSIGAIGGAVAGFAGGMSIGKALLGDNLFGTLLGRPRYRQWHRHRHR